MPSKPISVTLYKLLSRSSMFVGTREYLVSNLLTDNGMVFDAPGHIDVEIVSTISWRLLSLS